MYRGAFRTTGPDKFIGTRQLRHCIAAELVESAPIAVARCVFEMRGGILSQVVTGPPVNAPLPRCDRLWRVIRKRDGHVSHGVRRTVTEAVSWLPATRRQDSLPLCK